LGHAAAAALSLPGVSAAADDAPRPDALVASVAGASSVYVDTDHVSVVTPAVSAEIGDSEARWRGKARYAADVISGASVDLVSSASHFEPGTARWDEVRHVATAEGWYEPRSLGAGVNAAVSSEPDCLMLAGGGAISWEVAPERWALGVGYTRVHDVIGRSGTSFRTFSKVQDDDGIQATAMFRASPSIVLRLVADGVFARGYQSSPYRYLPVFNAVTGPQLPKGASVEEVNARRASVLVLENVPDTRNRYALTVGIDYRTDAGTLRAAGRFYADSWSLYAWTTDAGYLWTPSSRWGVGPNLRVHAQTGVDFWRRAYVPGTADGASFVLPAFRTGDRQLGPLVTLGGGVRMSYGFGPEARPSAWTLILDGTVMQTAFLDHLYVTSRTAELASLGVLASFE
jgi:hypothetical protein